MTKDELNQLQQTVNILDKESNRFDVYGDEGVIVLETATAAVLRAIRAASLEVSKQSAKSPWRKRLVLAIKLKWAVVFK